MSIILRVGAGAVAITSGQHGVVYRAIGGTGAVATEDRRNAIRHKGIVICARELLTSAACSSTTAEEQRENGLDNSASSRTERRSRVSGRCRSHANDARTVVNNKLSNFAVRLPTRGSDGIRPALVKGGQRMERGYE